MDIKMRIRPQNCWRKLKTLLFEYLQHSSIHGINYIAEPNSSWFELIWWLAALCVLVVGCGKFIFDAWQINPIIISFTGKPTPIWQIPFPAVTICPTIPTDDQNLRSLLEKGRYGSIHLDKVSEEEKQQFIALNSACPLAITFYDAKNYTNCNGCLEKLRELMMPMDKLFLQCKYKNQVIDCKNHLKELVLNRGLCYTFNGVGLYRRMKEDRMIDEWTIDEGYAPTASVDAYPYRATGCGARFGLSLLMGYKKKALDVLCDRKSGFWVEYKMQHEVPQLTTRHVTAPVGSSMILIVDPKLMTTSDAMRAYSVTERKCYFSDERRLKYFLQYTQPNCEIECEADYVLAKCGCLMMFIEDRRGFDTCGPSQQFCLIDRTEDIQLYNHEGCNCLPTCSSIGFESEILIDDLNMTDLKQTNYIEPTDYVYTKLTIVFKNNQFMTSQRTELYGRTDFLANCGGLLGLFLGASVISCLEIVYFCCVRLWFGREFEETRIEYAKTSQNNGGLLRVLKLLSADYYNKTTIQGIKYVANTQLSLLERLWWSMIVVVSIFCCGSLISDIFRRYRLSPVTINLTKDEIPISQIPFPAFTVCPQITVTDVKNMNLYFKTKIHSLYGVDQDFADSVTALAQVCDPEVFGNLDPQNLTSCEKCSTSLSKLMGPVKDLLFECESTNLNPCYDIFREIMTEEGVCLTFNALNIYREDTIDVDKTFESLDWSLESGYQANMSLLEVYPLPGSKFNVRISLDMAKILNDHVCKGPVQGYKLFLHLPNEAPQVSKHFYLLPYNHITQLSINPKMVTTAPELRDLPIEKRQCYFSDERYLRFFRFYTHNNCESECVANMTIKRCGCLRFHMTKIPGVKFCGIGDIKCYRSIMPDISKNIDQVTASDCNCLPACTSITYDAEIYQFLSEENNLKDSEFSAKFDTTEFSVGFKDTQFVALQRSLIYGKTEFVANCGGLLSVFLGFSFMSIVELVYFYTIRLVCRFKTLLK